MGRLSESQLARVMAFLATAPVGTRVDPIPAVTLIGLRDLIGADSADYFELRRSDRAVLGTSQSDAVESAPGSEEAMHAYGLQNPLNWRRWRPIDGALRLSGRITRRNLLRLEFYQQFMLPNRLDDTLKVWLWSSPESVACVQLWRGGSEFTRRDQDLLAVLQQGLVALREEGLSFHPAAWEDEATLTTREAEVLVLACRGMSDGTIAERLGTSAGTIGKHLQQAYDKLGVHSRSEAQWHVARRLSGRARNSHAGSPPVSR